MSTVLKNVDCIELYVSDLDEGMAYYCNCMGLKLLWCTETTVGLGMEDGITEIVLQTNRKKLNVDFKVESVIDTIDKVITAGGQIISGPFNLPIGKCAVICDKWNNQYVILDMTNGKYIADESGNVIGVEKED